MIDSQELRRIQNIIISLILLANVILWLVPSDVVELVAREQPVLMGHYSISHFMWNLGIGLLSPIVIFVLQPAQALRRRRRAYGILASIVALLPMYVIASLLLTTLTTYPYVSGKTVYHRPPGIKFESVYEDLPDTKRSFPNRPPGFGMVPCVGSFDANGYRNASVPKSCDIVTVGDSFTEGSRVSDGQEWPARLATISGMKIYNVGISGYGLPEYLAALRAYGLPQKPRQVLCMLYEGNDFRSTEMMAKTGVNIIQALKVSPLNMKLRQLMLNLFEPIGANWSFRGMEILDWMPLQLAGKFYAFAPKQLLELYTPAEEFEASESWFTAKSLLKEMKSVCRDAGAELVIIYAPNKAHIVFPPRAADLPGEHVREYLALREKKELPDSSTICKRFVEMIDRRESVIANWCDREGLQFISLTAPLREASIKGRQCYYTYDQHWSRVGHEIAAEYISRHLRRR